jgi:hypothetical protein
MPVRLCLSFLKPSPNYLRPKNVLFRETVRSLLILYMLYVDDDLARYSNTLLVSLNNRISLREAIAINEVEVISVALKPLQVAASQSGSNMDSSIERPPIAYKAVAREPCSLSLLHVQ